jgi:hypothetical protein
VLSLGDQHLSDWPLPCGTVQIREKNGPLENVLTRLGNRVTFQVFQCVSWMANPVDSGRERSRLCG